MSPSPGAPRTIRFRSCTRRFDVGSGEVRLTYEGVNASGRHDKSTQTVDPDGQAHEHPQAPGIFVVSSLGARALVSTATRGDAVVGHGAYDVSEDGQTLTATIRGVDAAGKPFDQVIVFDRAE